MRAAGVLVVAVLAIAGPIACRCGEEAAPPAPDVGETAPAGGERGLLPPPGQLRIETRAGHLTVLANAVPRRELLVALSKRLEFDLVAWDRRNPPETLRAVDSSLEDVLSEILDRVPYSLDYEVDADGGATRVSRLTVGRESDHAGRDPEGDARREDAGLEPRIGDWDETDEGVPRERSPREFAPGERERIAAVRAESRERRRQERVAGLESPDPEERARAAFRLDAEDPRNVDALSRALRDDPDPRVRAEAAQRFMFGEPQTAVPVLVSALADPNPDVVLEAVKALEFLDDPAALRDLEPLLEHDDARVRKQAGAAIEVLEMTAE